MKVTPKPQLSCKEDSIRDNEGKTHSCVSPQVSVLYDNAASLLTPDVWVFFLHIKQLFHTSWVSYNFTQF